MKIYVLYSTNIYKYVFKKIESQIQIKITLYVWYIIILFIFYYINI